MVHFIARNAGFILLGHKNIFRKYSSTMPLFIYIFHNRKSANKWTDIVHLDELLQNAALYQGQHFLLR